MTPLSFTTFEVRFDEPCCMVSPVPTLAGQAPAAARETGQEPAISSKNARTTFAGQSFGDIKTIPYACMALPGPTKEYTTVFKKWQFFVRNSVGFFARISDE
jgi:hypothetical protein